MLQIRTVPFRILMLLSAFFTVNAAGMDSFLEAKKVLPNIYQKLPDAATLYCGCDVTVTKKGYLLDLNSCGYQSRKLQKRPLQVEIEHVVSAWELGHQQKCWQDGGRKNCTKSSKEFNLMEGDLHNLYPAVSEINRDRSNYRFSDWNGTAYQYGKCDMIVDFKGRKVQPPERSRGIIARAYLYMRDTYGLRLSSSQTKLFEAWDLMYPASKTECKRNDLITEVQGNDNYYISRQCR